MRESPGTAHVFGSCAVCGERDTRALATSRLASGESVVVCGTHELMHKRSTKQARTLTELRSLFLERRRMGERRNFEGDELGAQLARAFANERRYVDRRG